MPLDPLISNIEVPCDQQTAFEVFTSEMATWWPLEKRSMSAHHQKSPKALRVDARVGGRIVEVAFDGHEHHWGTYRSFNPFTSVVLDFHIGLPAANASTVQVDFMALDDSRTKVVLTQSNWEAFGDLAEVMRGGYGSGWVLIFEGGFKDACSRRGSHAETSS